MSKKFGREMYVNGLDTDVRLGTQPGRGGEIVTNRSDPALPHQNAPEILRNAMARAKEEAKVLCNNCVCRGKPVRIAFELVGHDNPARNERGQLINPFIMNFQEPAWEKFFKPQVVNCPE
jgi:hypothetical protein